RFWNKFLKDRGFAPTEEPFKKLINQGMILGMSAYAYRLIISIKANKVLNGVIESKGSYNIFISKNDLDNFRKNNVLPVEIENYIKKLTIENILRFVKYENVSLDEISENKYIIKIKNDEYEFISSFDFDPYLIDLSVINDITNEL